MKQQKVEKVLSGSPEMQMPPKKTRESATMQYSVTRTVFRIAVIKISFLFVSLTFLPHTYFKSLKKNCQAQMMFIAYVFLEQLILTYIYAQSYCFYFNACCFYFVIIYFTCFIQFFLSNKVSSLLFFPCKVNLNLLTGYFRDRLRNMVFSLETFLGSRQVKEGFLRARAQPTKNVFNCSAALIKKKIKYFLYNFIFLSNFFGVKIGQGRFLAGERRSPQNALCFKYFYIVGRVHKTPPTFI